MHETPLLRLRPALPTDGEALARIYGPVVREQSTSFELEPPDGAEMARRVASVTVQYPWLVAESEGGVIGYAYAGQHRARPAYQWTVEMSAYIDPAVHRSGAGRRLYSALLAILALQGFRTAVAGITLPNPASVRFHQSMGFEPVGVFPNMGYKHGAWHDVAWFSRAIAPAITDPPAPRPFPELLGGAALATILGAGNGDA